MLTRPATLLSLILPALALAAPRHLVETRAGAAFGEVFAGAPSKYYARYQLAQADQAVSNITIRADNVAQCQTATISWMGANVGPFLPELMRSLRLTRQEPVSLYIALGGLYVGETPITTLYDLYGGSTTWLVNQSAGKTMEFRVTDAKGAVAYVQNVKIGQGDISCLSGAASTSSTAGAASATWSPVGTSTTWSEETWSSAASTSQAVQGDAEGTPADLSTLSLRVISVNALISQRQALIRPPGFLLRLSQVPARPLPQQPPPRPAPPPLQRPSHPLVPQLFLPLPLPLPLTRRSPMRALRRRQAGPVELRRASAATQAWLSLCSRA